MAESMDVQAPVAVVGNGRWGTVLSNLLSINAPAVKLWVDDEKTRDALVKKRKHPRLPGVKLAANIQVVATPGEIASAQTLFLALHPERFVPVCRALGDHLRGDHRVVGATKGLEAQSARRLSQIIRDESCVKKVGALAGPRLTSQFAKGAPGAGVIASHFPEVVEGVMSALNSERYRVYAASDVIGVEYGSVFASVVAFLAGLVDGMGWGPGVQAIVVTRGLAEISRLGMARGAKFETFSGMGCLGVVLGATLTQKSPEFSLGRQVAKAEAPVEALIAAQGEQSVLEDAKCALVLAQNYGVQMPLMAGVVALLTGQATPDALRGALMTRPVGRE